jgi:hypothetical protein
MGREGALTALRLQENHIARFKNRTKSGKILNLRK